MTQNDVYPNIRLNKPDWLKIKLPSGKNYTNIKEIVSYNHLHTICESGKCPNIGECWGNCTATFMILGNICTRSCQFCAVKSGKPLPPSPYEPENIARAIQLIKLKHCVITSVSRDDLEDFGASVWAETITVIRKINPLTTIEALIPDFNEVYSCLDYIIKSGPNIISHNLETIHRLSKLIRSKADYTRSLNVLLYLKNNGVVTKSGIMAGLGETDDEVFQTMDDLLRTGCKIMTIGQYLQPTREHLPVNRYVNPGTFEHYRKIGIQKGFKIIESAPLVRSSYHAEKHIV